MRKINPKNKINLFLLIVMFQFNNVIGQADFNPTIVNSNSSAVNFSSAGSSDGETTFKTLTYTIPFFQNTFTNNIKFTHDGNAYLCNNTKKLRLTYNNNNNLNSVESITNIIEYNIVNLSCTTPTTTVFIDISFLCLTNQAPGQIYSNPRKQKIKVIIIKEPNPLLNITFNKFCWTDTKTPVPVNTGDIGLKANGNYNNADYLYFVVNGNSVSNSSCNNSSVSKTRINSIVSVPGILNQSAFYSCGGIGSYTVSLEYRRNTIGNFSTTTVYQIPQINSFGWVNYNFTKNKTECMTPMAPNPRKI